MGGIGAALLRVLPERYLLLGRDLVISEVSDAYLASARQTRDEVLGRSVLDVAGEWIDPSTEGRETQRAALECMLGDGQSQTTERWSATARGWRSTWVPLRDESGEVTEILQRVEDITDEVLGHRSRALLEHAPDAFVIVDHDGRIQLVNVQTELMFGYTRGELIGLRIETLIPERFGATHLGHVARFFAAPTVRPMGSALQLFGRRKDGAELPIEVSLSPQHDARGLMVSASIRDVSARRELELAQRVTDDRLRSAVNAIQEALALFDGNSQLVLCNAPFLQLVHETDGAAVVGRLYDDLLERWIADVDLDSDDARERYRQSRRAARHQERSTFDVKMRDGRTLRVTDQRTADGGLVKTVWDLTEDEHRSVELRDARQTAEAASAAKSDFLSSMSHELRTPLNAVLGFAQLLVRDRKEPLSDRQRDRAEQIGRGGEHLLRLIDDILDLAKIEAGRISMSLEPVAVADVLDEIRRTLDPIAHHQGITVAIDPVSPALPLIMADRTRFSQILINFGSNAIKYNRRAGAVRFTVTNHVSTMVRVVVADTGLGIPLDRQDKLFQPFQRAGQETGPIEGTGIGLVITRRLAELMGGVVGFRSVPGQGSEFWVDMPIHHADHARVVEVRARPPALRPSRTLHRVLYIEDNPANVAFMRDLVSTLDDIELLTVPTAEIGIQLARAEQPDLVLMDINLPGMSGLQALQALRALPETAQIPVIALTAAASARDRQRGDEVGFYRYLTKPVKVDELISAIETLFADR